MIGFKVGPLNSDNFFNSEKVMKLLSDAERKTLSKFGAYVRQTAKRSIRPAINLNRKERLAAKKSQQQEPKPLYQASQPGEAPRSRQGDLKKFILFGYDAGSHSVVIGPTLTSRSDGLTPGRLEFGGEVKLKNGRTVRVLKRPFMKPAFDKELARMPALFADSFGR